MSRNITTLNQLYDKFQDNAIYLYCMLVIGYDESNQTIIKSAYDKIKNSNLKYELMNLYTNTMGRTDDVDFLNKHIQLHVSYLALLFFVYATLVGVDDRDPYSTNIRGLVMNESQAIGWTYCLLNYWNSNYNPVVLYVDPLQLPNAINIVSVALATRYIERQPVINERAGTTLMRIILLEMLLGITAQRTLCM